MLISKQGLYIVTNDASFDIHDHHCRSPLCLDAWYLLLLHQRYYRQFQ